MLAPLPSPASVPAKVPPFLVYEIETPLGLGRLAPYQYERAVQQTRIRLFWGRIVVWVVGLLLAAWLLATGALYGYVKYGRGFSEVQYVHMLLLPWKMDEYRRTKGEAWLRDGLKAAEAGEWRSALDLLRGGLPTVPEDREARLMLTRIYLMAGRTDLARETLVAGLAYHPDELSYLRTVLGFLFEQQADAAVIDLAVELGDRLTPDTAAGRTVATARAFALFNRDAYAEAEAVFRAAGLVHTPEARFVSARTAWERGRRDEALTRLRALHAQASADEEIYRTLVFYLREAGQAGEARRVALARSLARPDYAESRVDFLELSWGAGEETRELENDFLKRFSGDAPALLRLANAAAKKGRGELVWRVAERCRELGREQAASYLIGVQAELERGAYREALGAIVEVWNRDRLARSPSEAGWSEAQVYALRGLRAVALYGSGQAVEAEAELEQARASRVLSAPTLTLLAEQLARVAPQKQVAQILTDAVERDPLFQAALVARLRMALKEGDLAGAGVWIERLAAMRKPPVDLVQGLTSALQSDRFWFLAGRERLLAQLNARMQK